MRQSIGTIHIFEFVLASTLLFAAFLTLALSYNRAYRLKNETLSILEKYEGVSNTSLKLINRYLSNSGYNEKGSCESDEYGMVSLDYNNPTIEKAKTKSKYYYCLKSICKDNNCKINSKSYVYYDFKLFFRFNLPFLGDLMLFKINGETKDIKLYSNNQLLSEK